MHPLSTTYANWNALTAADKERAADELVKTSRGHWILNRALFLAIEHERERRAVTEPGSDLFDMEVLHDHALSLDRIGDAMDGKRPFPIQ